MNETHSHTPHTLPGHGPSTIIMVGAGMGISGALLGLLLFLVACFGMEGSFLFSPLPLVTVVALWRSR